MRQSTCYMLIKFVYLWNVNNVRFCMLHETWDNKYMDNNKIIKNICLLFSQPIKLVYIDVLIHNTCYCKQMKNKFNCKCYVQVSVKCHRTGRM